MTTWDLPAGSGARFADDYERGRPGWPDGVAVIPGLSPDAVVVDLAAGTGKLTRVLRKRYPSVIAVEPQAALRAILEGRTSGVDVRNGTAQELPLDDAAADGVFVAQAFHWFADRLSLEEIARVLRPDGVLVLMWNLPAGPWQPSVLEAERLLLEHAPSWSDDLDPLDFSVAHATDWRNVVAESAFGAIHDVRIPNPQLVDADGLIAYFASMGWIAGLSDSRRLPLLDAVRARLHASQYRREWETRLSWCRLAAPAA